MTGRLRASYTIENSYIIPMFTMIIIILIAVTFYFHDMAVIKNILIQVDIQAEQCTQMTEKDIERLCNEAQADIKKRTIFTRDIRVEINNENSEWSAKCSAVFMAAGVIRETGKIEKQEKVKKYYQPEFIRKINAVEKIVSGR